MKQLNWFNQTISFNSSIVAHRFFTHFFIFRGRLLFIRLIFCFGNQKFPEFFKFFFCFNEKEFWVDFEWKYDSNEQLKWNGLLEMLLNQMEKIMQVQKWAIANEMSNWKNVHMVQMNFACNFATNRMTLAMHRSN